MAELSQTERRSIAAALESIAREAGRVLSDGFRRPVRAEHKGPLDLVTEFDRRSEAVIREREGVALADLKMLEG